ncbi:MAG: hypothetical protein QM831_16565 [Kofleriaceae bacterium]
MRRLLVLLAACGGGSDHGQPKPVVPQDAPAAHIPPEPQPVRVADPDSHRPPTGRTQGHPIDIILRSTPQAANAAVDGVPLGTTPTYWNGMADGREHEFTFVLPGHAAARYRFVPITSGVVHARLEPISDEQPDAGVAPSPLAPGPAPTVQTDPIPPGIPAITQDAAPMLVPDAAPAAAEPHGNGPLPF